MYQDDLVAAMHNALATVLYVECQTKPNKSDTSKSASLRFSQKWEYGRLLGQVPLISNKLTMRRRGVMKFSVLFERGGSGFLIYFPLVTLRILYLLYDKDTHIFSFVFFGIYVVFL